MSEQEIKKVNGNWKGTPINIKKVWGGHEFTADECAKLFNDEIIEFEAVSKKGNTYTVKGKLEKQNYEGHEFIGFKPIFNEKPIDTEKFEGIWNGKSVKIKRTWSNHTFTGEEIQCLLDGGTIRFEAKSKKTGNNYTVKGHLAEQSFEGHTFVGFKPIFDN